MKFVIDIPEELTKKDRFYTEKDKWSIVDAVQNSVSLDDIFDHITTTIEKYKDDCGKPEDIGYFSDKIQSTIGAYEVCLRIINYWKKW